MRVAVYRNNRDVRLEDRPRPVLGPGELLLKVEASGICGSDAMEWYRVPRAPLILGHEVAGTVAEIGDGVTRFKVGDRVVTTHHIPCNCCRYCTTDRHSACETLRTTNFDPGGFAEYVRLPQGHVDVGTFRLPDDVSFEEGSFVEPLACVIRAQRLARLPEACSYVVLGSGVSGCLHIQYARSQGAGCIIATDVNQNRLDHALRFGADAAIDVTATADAGAEIARVVRERNQGRLAECVVVCTGARQAFQQALTCVDRGGAILFFAPLPPGETLDLPSNDLWRQGVSLLHSYAGPPAEMQMALDCIASRQVDVASMITHRLPLAETQQGFRLLTEADAALKVIIEPQR